eukprot:2369606-Amphidinium_carterae.1
MIYNALIGTQHISTKLLLGSAQDTIDTLDEKVYRVIERHVEQTQLQHPLGIGKGGYPDVECDEVTVAKRHRDDGTVAWTQYWGAMRRGAPSTL